MLFISLLGVSQNTLKVRRNIEVIEFLNGNKTDSITANIKSSNVNINIESQGVLSPYSKYFFYDDKVIIFEYFISDKLKKKASKNKERFLVKIAKLKKKKKIEYQIFDATIKEITISRINFISEGGYTYFEINRTTNDTLAKKIIPPTPSFATFTRYGYEVTINGEKFTSPILYKETQTDKDIARILSTSISTKIRETIPIGNYDANKAIEKQKLHFDFTEYSYFSNTITLRGLLVDNKLHTKVGFNIKNDLIKIESNLDIFNKEGTYNRKSEKITFKEGSLRVTFKR